MKLKTLIIAVLLLAHPSMAAKSKTVEFTYATKGDAHSMDPAGLYEVVTQRFLTNIYESLISRDNDLKIIPSLAESWENRDPLTWIFHLRRSVKFHDRTPFTADDVVFTYTRLSSDDSDVKGAISSIKSIEKLDEYTVKVTTKTPTPTLLDEIYALQIMSKSWCEKHKCERVIKLGKAGKSFADMNACGTGAYMVVERKPDVKTVLKRNPDWWGNFEGNIEQITYRPVPTDSTRIAGLQTGEFDFVEPVPLQDIERIKQDPKLDIMMKPGLNTLYLSMNVGAKTLESCNIKDRNPFADVRVRQAVSHALDLDGLCGKILLNAARPAGLMVAPGIRGYDEPMDKPLPFDQEKSKALLAEAGYPNGFTVELDVPTDRYIKDEQVGQALVGMLAKVGITIKLVAQTKSKYFAKVLGGKTDMYFMGWMPGTYDVHDPYSNMCMTRMEGQGAYNIGCYTNPEMDRLLKTIHAEMDPLVRQANVLEMYKIHGQDRPQIPLYQEFLVFGKTKNIEMQQRADGYILHHLTKKK